MRRTLQLTAFATCAIGVALVGVATANGLRATKDGVITTEQIARGKTVYEQSCKNCHQEDFYRERLTRWENKSVEALFEAVSTTMPADNVGSLATSEYLDVLAYVFSITGAPTGSTELTADNMGAVKVSAPK
jgi:mono/diheme cytochrome c family protein